MRASPQVRLELLLQRGNAGDGDLRFGVSLDGVEATPGQAQAQRDHEQLEQRCEKRHWAYSM